MTRSISAVCDIPDYESEGAEYEDDELAEPGGRRAAEVVVRMVEELGYSCGDLEADLEHNSWETTARKDGASFCLNIFQLDDEFHITTDNMTGCLGMFGGHRAEYKGFLDALLAKVAADPRFREVSLDD